MEDLYKRIRNQRGALAKLGESIPGYRGYQDAQARREADKLLRDHLVRQFDEQLQRIPPIEKQLLNQGGIEWMDDTASLKTLMQTFIEKIRTAARGYAGLFGQLKVDGDALERLYAFDATMLDYVDEFQAKVDALEQAAAEGEGLRQAINELDALTREATQAFSLRSEVLTGLTGEGEPPFDLDDFFSPLHEEK